MEKETRSLTKEQLADVLSIEMGNMKIMCPKLYRFIFDSKYTDWGVEEREVNVSDEKKTEVLKMVEQKSREDRRFIHILKDKKGFLRLIASKDREDKIGVSIGKYTDEIYTGEQAEECEYQFEIENEVHNRNEIYMKEK